MKNRAASNIQYSTVPLETVQSVAKALGISEKHAFAPFLLPERVLYHSVLAAVIMRVFLPELDEKRRGEKIANITDEIYTAVRPEFLTKIGALQPNLETTHAKIDDYVERIHRSVAAGHSLNVTLFNLMWDLDNYPESWHKRAVNTYRIARQRLQHECAETGDCSRVRDITAFWTKHNYEFKQYRHAARELAYNYIDSTLSAYQLIIPVPATERRMAVFTGGMGSGKSFLTKMWLERLKEEDLRSLFIQDADYLKIALARHGDGVKQYSGTEVHDESANVLYELSRKISFLAKTGQNVPHLVMNNIELGEDRLVEAVAGGGAAEVHHISIDPFDAIAATTVRGQITGRTPDPSDVYDSIKRSAKNLLTLTQYQGANLTVYLYEREQDAPCYVGLIDVKEGRAVIEDLAAFKRILIRTEIDTMPEKSWQKAVNLILGQNLKLVVMDSVEPEKILLVLDPDRVLSIDACNSDPFAQEKEYILTPFAGSVIKKRDIGFCTSDGMHLI